MNKIRKYLLIGLGLFSISTAGWLLLKTYAAENQSPASDAPAPGDKWAQINQKNEEILKSIDAIELNLQFIKARSMSGGRGS